MGVVYDAPRQRPPQNGYTVGLLRVELKPLLRNP